MFICRKQDVFVYSTKDLELQGLTLTGNGQHAQKNIDIYVTYRPPGGDSNVAKNVIVEKVGLISDSVNREVIIIGDLNWNCQPENIYISELCEELNLTQIIDYPTRITHGRSSVLDVILTNMKNVAQSGCINHNISDHLPVFVVKKRLTKPVELEIIRKRTFKNYDQETFGDRLFELDWSILDLLHDVNLAWSMLYKGMLFEVNKLCPYKEFRIKKNRPIWYNSEICSLGRERDIILRNYRRSGSNNERLYLELVSKRKEFNRIVKKAKANFYNEQILHCKSDPKNFWRMIGDLLGNEQSKAIDRVFLDGTEVLCEEDNTADVINKFFAMVGTNRGASNRNINEYKQLDPAPDVVLEEFIPITCDNLIDILKELNENKSSGVNEINSTLIFDAIYAIPEIFVKIINLSLSTGNFPEEW